jgi:hypothetical protein
MMAVDSDLAQAEHALERGDMAALANRMQAALPDDPRAAKAHEFIVAVLSSPGAVAPIGQELPFLNSAAQLIRSRDVLPPGTRLQLSPDPDAPIRRHNQHCDETSGRNPIVIDEELDFFGEGNGMAARTTG